MNFLKKFEIEYMANVFTNQIMRNNGYFYFMLFHIYLKNLNL